MKIVNRANTTLKMVSFAHILKHNYQRLALVMVIVSLTGCASVPVALTLATVAGAGLGYTIVAEESPIDALVSYSVDKDCNALRKGKDNGPYCRPIKKKIEQKETIQSSSRCYKTLGGMVCYSNEQQGAKEVKLKAQGLNSSPIIVVAEEIDPELTKSTAVPELDKNNQEEEKAKQTKQIEQSEKITGDILTTPSIPGVLLSGESLKPVPKPVPKDNRTKYVPNKRVEETSRAQYGGLGDYLPGLAESKKNTALKKTLDEISKKQRGDKNADPSYRSDKSPKYSSPIYGRTRNDLSGQPGGGQKLIDQKGLGAPENGVYLTGPYKDYNPSWIRPFPYSYRKRSIGKDNPLYYRLPGVSGKE